MGIIVGNSHESFTALSHQPIYRNYFGGYAVPLINSSDAEERLGGRATGDSPLVTHGDAGGRL